MRKMLLMVVGMAVSVAQGATYYVSAEGDNGDGLSWATAKQTIQAAIDLAVAGDEVVVADGTYTPISSNDKPITIRSVNGAKVTIIDGGGTNRCAMLGSTSGLSTASGTNTVLSGFTLTNGVLNTMPGSSGGGGGVFSGRLYHCVITGNSTTGFMGHGGGASYSTLNSCLLVGNWTQGGNTGGGAYNCILNNCTVYGNSAQNMGSGGVHNGTVRNSIIWGNMPSNVFGGETSFNSLTDPTLDPLFVDAENGDFRLRFGSPCIDAGDNDYASYGATDIAGNPRILNGRVDIGAYEFVTITNAVTFNANGGEPATQDITQTYCGDYILPDSNPTLLGYTFAGWYTEQNGGEQVTESTLVMLTIPHTIYAQWTHNGIVNVFFDANGGAPAITNIVQTINVNYTLPDPDPSRVDHTFAGWFTAATEGTQVTDGTQMTTPSPHTLYAHWTHNGTVTVFFDANGGAPAVQSVTLPLGTTRYTFPPVTPTWGGRTFIGWYFDDEGTGSPVLPQTPLASGTAHTLYAKWSEGGAVPTVYAFADGPGTVTMSPANGQVVSGKPVTLTAKPDKDAVFVDWSTGDVTATIKVAPPADTVYVARFRLKADCTPPSVTGIQPSVNRMVGVPFAMQVEVSDAAKPVKFRASRLPLGLKINAATGLISGVPSRAGIFNPVIKVTSVVNPKKSVTRTVPITIEALPLTAQGTFNGYVSDDAGGVCGSFRATVSAKGKFSARVVSTNGTWTFSAPSWADKEDDVFFANAKTPQGQTLALTLDSAAPWDTEQVSGVCGGFGETALPVTAQRAPYLNKKDATFNDALNTLTSYQGYYTLALAAGGVIADSVGDADNIPGGYGYLTATIDTKGGVKFAGRLADGTEVSGSVPLLIFAGNAEVPCFIPLYSSRGLAAGRLQVQPDGTLGGPGWQWLYPGKTPARTPPATEDRFGLTLLPGGGRYGTIADLADYYTGLSFNAFTNTVAIIPDGKGGVILPAAKKPAYDAANNEFVYAPVNPSVATLTANKATGLFSGTFNLYEEYLDAKGNFKLKTTSVSHQGVLLPGERTGGGYYLVPETWKSGNATYPLKRSYPVWIE